MTAPPTISHTSLPSQNGPIVLIATRLSMSVCPTKRCRIPTPKSNPSSTKKPVQNTATTENQKTSRLIAAALVRQGRRPGAGRLVGGLVRLKLETTACVAQHEKARHDPEHDVDAVERDQAQHDVGRAHRWRHAVFGQHEPLDDPRLSAILGEHPAGRLNQEGRDDRPRSEE